MPSDIKTMVAEGVERAILADIANIRKSQRLPRDPERRMRSGVGTMYQSAAGIRKGVMEAAGQKRLIRITYRKTAGDKKTKRYLVEPYEVKWRILKVGRRKVLWAHDTKEDKIKSFAMSSIKLLVLEDETYSPRWPIKIRRI